MTQFNLKEDIFQALGITQTPSTGAVGTRTAPWVNAIFQLVHAGRLERLERVATILRHLEETPAVPSSDGRSPGVVYLPDPFQGRSLHDLFVKLDIQQFNWENVGKYLDGEYPILETTVMTEADKVNLERLILVLLYLAVYATGPCDAAGAQRIFEDVLAKIREQRLGIMTHSRLGPNVWKESFDQQNLRLQKIVGGKRYSSNVLLNEVFESIRVRNLRLQGFIPLDSANEEATVNIPTPNVQQLGGVLACSFYTIIEFTDQSDFIAFENLRILAHYAAQLPASWYSAEFLRSLLVLGRRALSSDAGLFQPSLAPIIRLFSFWIRKTDSFASLDMPTDILQFVATTAQELISQPNPSPSILPYCLAALAASIGKLTPEMDLTAIETLCTGLQHLPSFSPVNQDALYTALVHPMKILPPAPFGALNEALIAAWAHQIAPRNTPPELLSVEGGIKIMYLYQYVTQARWESDASTEAKSSRAWWRIRSLKETSVEIPEWLASLSDAITSASSNAAGKQVQCGVALMAQVGIWRAFSDRLNKGNGAVKSVSKERTARRFVQKRTLDALIAASDQVNEPSTNEQQQVCQELLAYGCAQVLGYLNSPDVDRLEGNWQGALETVVDVLFTHHTALALEEGFLRQLSLEVSKAKEPQKLFSERLKAKVNKASQHPIYAEMGRMSKAIGVLIDFEWNNGEYDTVLRTLETMRQFCQRLYTEWETCNVDGSVLQSSQDHKDTYDSLWQYFKTALFVVTVISKSFVDTLFDHQHHPNSAVDQYSHSAVQAVQLVLETFSYMHFVTARFGLGGFKAWQETVQGLVAWLETPPDLMQDAKQANQTSTKIEDTMRLLTPAYCGLYVESNPVSKCRLLFHLTLARQLMRHLPEGYVANDVLPRVYPYLRFHRPQASIHQNPTTEDKDLFEMAHAICVSTFEHVSRFRNIVRSFAPWYAELLLEYSPEPIDFDLLRRCFAFLIKSLSAFSSAHQGRLILSTDVENEEDDDEGAQASGRRTGRDISESGREMELSESHGESGEDGGNLQQQQQQDAKNKDSELSNVGEPDAQTALQEEEGDALAWNCLARLVTHIDRLSHQIDTFEQHQSESQPFANDGSSRLKQILSVAGPADIIMQRDQLAIVLFDQVRTIALSGLEALLATIENLMLDGHVPSFLAAEEVPDDANAVETTTGHSMPESRRRGIGVQTNPDRSPLWKALFDAVGHSRGFDYTRRERCVQWYLTTIRAGKELWEKDRHTGTDGADSNHRPLPVGHPLRAKL
ncbi:uncharacterized protein SPPG_01050 [Spizellomyces punctatus DAOM BR117]|uniref:Uncharacterized protein n=1 Tax=Spizellomyces punctatus (strain DAOM BR117) TaxID=645134 RepID=A0A0L0HRR4_SPIPD|nr:uncharacterized protein SPPG_01050 [Spizellomyces punctatus DAOM BR117]KND03575.1 hypothetical protein SPPG_01050 [Spizellomyces punctatus DAOM BR117]|eukprot:XP_016611614.1 hypothetical protein SPPG_01050 [Spizellomyces punctatus DAOM BR117]